MNSEVKPKVVNGMVSLATDPVGLTVEYIKRWKYDPVGWAEHTYGVRFYPDQVEFLKAYGRALLGTGPRRLSKVSGHRVGKTMSLAIIIVHHAVFCFPQKTAVTAPTEKQLFNALANEVKAWIGKLPPELCALFEPTKERIEFRPAPNESFITFAVSRAETPEALAGAHSENPLLVADEASGIPDSVFEAASSIMAGAKGIMILAGNPIRTSGLFYDTHHRLRHLWWTQQVSSLGHPNVSPEWIEEKRAEYGSESNRFRVRVLGEFPKAEEDKVISFSDIEAALNRDVAAQPVQPIWGLDIARSLYRDSSALAKRQGNVLLEPVQTWRYIDPMQSVGRVKREWDETPPSKRPSAIVFDVIGEGSGVGYRLLEMGLPMVPVNVAEVEPVMEPEKYANLRAELYYAARDWFARKDCRIAGTDKDGREWRDDALAAELAEPKYKYRGSGKIVVESKDDMKKRGVPSPNRADAFVLTFAVPAVSANVLSVTAPYSRSEPLPSRGISYV